MKLLIIENFKINLKDKNILNKIQKQLCLSYSSKYRKSNKPRSKIIEILNELNNKSYHLQLDMNDIKLGNIQKIISELGFNFTIIDNDNLICDKIMNLFSYEKICDRCYGAGEIHNRYGSSYTTIGQCEKCNGIGKVDWIDEIVKKNRS